MALNQFDAENDNKVLSLCGQNKSNFNTGLDKIETQTWGLSILLQEPKECTLPDPVYIGSPRISHKTVKFLQWTTENGHSKNIVVHYNQLQNGDIYP